MSIANFLEDKLLDLVFNATSYAGQSTVYVKLHTADPGETGASNAATEATRKALSVGPSSGGVVTSDADVNWTNVAATETYSHISLWDAVTAGNCLWSGPLSVSKAVTAGDNFSIPSGSLTVSLD